MQSLRIAFLQIQAGDTPEQTLRLGQDACRKAKAMGADVALFPEMFSIGYDVYDTPPQEWTRRAIPQDDPFLSAFGALAKELQMAVGITFLEAWPGAPRNTLQLFDRFGKKVFTYAKVHTCDFGAEQALTPGDEFYVAPLDTAAGVVQVGAMICYDREFPESGRLLMLKGAELVLVPNACPMEQNRLSQLRGRAFENMMAIATCNYPNTVPDCNGGSSLFDGVAYLPELSGSRDTCLLLAPPQEGIYVADLDLEQLRQYRQREVHGNAYRRPKLYSDLCQAEVLPPFIRPDARR